MSQCRRVSRGRTVAPHSTPAGRCRGGAARVEGLECRQLLAAALPPEPSALLADINQTTKDSNPATSAELGGQVVFAAESLETGRELWITTGAGAPTGARLFADVLPGPASSSPLGVVSLGGRALFWGDDGTDTGNRHVWASDGTEAGTRQLLPGFSWMSSAPFGKILVSGDRAYFAATDGDHIGPSPTGRAGIYSTDGTPEGTRLEAVAPRVFDFAAHDGAVYYLGNAEGSGTTATLYRLDPGAGGGPSPAPVALTPEGVSATGPLFILGDTLLFNAGGRPWRTDGTPEGTRLVTDRQLTTSGSTVQRAVRLANGRIVFGAGNRLFALNTDGTVTGPIGFQQPAGLVAAGDVAYFAGEDGGTALAALWRTDGTVAGTRMVQSIPGSRPGISTRPIERLTALGNRVLFRAFGTQGSELWVSDGTAAGTVLVEDINPGPAGSTPNADYNGGNSSDLRFFTSGGRAYFSAYTRDAGVELWRSDGTAAGTARVADVNGSTHDSSPNEESPPFGRRLENGVEFNGRTYFAADDGVRGRELWSTDGTASGTRMEAELAPGAASSDPMGLLVHDNALWFVANRGTLYRTDGAAGAAPVTSSAGRFGVAGLENEHVLFVYKGKVSFFGGYGGDATRPSGLYLMASDGTPDGTLPLGIMIDRVTTERVEEPTVSGNYVYFRWWGHQAGRQSLYRHDGSEARRIDDGVHPYQLTDVNGTLLYSADPTDPQLRGLRAVGPSGFTYKIPPVESVLSIEKLGNFAYVTGWSYASGNNYVLWRTDGTFAGTTEVTQLPQDAGWNMRAAGGKLWFSGSSSRMEPWVSDGTAAGTRSLGSLNPGGGGSSGGDPRWAAGPDGYVYFRGYRPDIGVELFRSDGTPEGTGLVADIIPGPTGSFPGPSMTAGGDLFFVADSVRYGREWWRVPEPAPPAARVVGRHVFYNASSFDAGDPAAGAADDNAIAADKNALLAGEDRLPGFDNVTSYDKGINGIMVDVAGLPAGGALTADDFDFGGALRPVSMTVRRGAGAGGSDRVTLIWTGYSPGIEVATLATAIDWLTVTVKATERTGLTQPDVFSFGNLIGETGDGGGAAGWRVSALDLSAVKRSLNSAAAITAATDFNRDGRTNALDLSVVKRNLNHSLPLFPGPVPATSFTALAGPAPWPKRIDRSDPTWVSGLLE